MLLSTFFKKRRAERIFSEYFKQPSAVAYRTYQHFKVQIRILVFKLILNVISAVLIHFKDYELLRTVRGYLPAKPAERNSRIKQLEARIYKENQSQIFIEAPYRNTKMIQSLLSYCRPDTLLCIASGITTQEEWIKTKSIAQWKKEKLPEIDKIPTIFILYK